MSEKINNRRLGSYFTLNLEKKNSKAINACDKPNVIPKVSGS